jgi:hypothetical protein
MIRGLFDFDAYGYDGRDWVLYKFDFLVFMFKHKDEHRYIVVNGPSLVCDLSCFDVADIYYCRLVAMKKLIV